MPSTETRGKGLDRNSDAAGRAGSVEWFNKHEVTQAGEGENQGCRSKTCKQIQKGWGKNKSLKTNGEGRK